MAATLVLAPAAQAKTCVTMKVTPRPVLAGTAAWIEMRFPNGAPNGAPHVWADGPRGAGDIVGLRQSPDDPTLYRVRYIFRRAGFWRLEWAEWSSKDSPCAGAIGLRVSRRR